MMLKKSDRSGVPDEQATLDHSNQKIVGSNERIKLTAIAMAILLSVTVSIGELTRGVFSVIFFVIGEARVTSLDAKSM